ncbi:GNAT family N-acetyltransferase, partial [Bifidobacterium boum]|nr:GNAT family N-acetyltransferase [Bifidobacterium boum]
MEEDKICIPRYKSEVRGLDMNHCGTYTIETKRLLLREFMVEDAEAMFQNWASDKEVTKFL